MRAVEAGSRRGGRVETTVVPGLIALVGAALWPWAATDVGVSNEAHTTIMVLALAATALTALLLEGHFRSDGSWRSLASAAAFSWTAGLMLVYAVAFPGVLHANLPVQSGQAAAWLWAAYHATFPLLLVLAALLPHGRDVNTIAWVGRRRYAWTAVGGAATLAVIAAAGVVAWEEHLPVVVSDGRDYGGLVELVGLPTLLCGAASLVLSYFTQGPLTRWLPSISMVVLVDVVLTLHSGSRFTLGWYAGRALFLVAVSVLLVGLLSRILGAFAQLVDVADELEDAAYSDPLTGLPNRRALQRITEPQGDKVVAVLDIDHFKRINDQLGHDTGDQVLQAVAGRIRHGLSRDDLLIRWGGDELVIVLDATGDDAIPVLNRIRRSMAEQPVRTDEAAVPVTISIGAASWHAGNGVEVALSEADRMLYEAKREGRNRVAMSSPNRSHGQEASRRGAPRAG